MATIAINDLEINNKLDQIAQENITGGHCRHNRHWRRRYHRSSRYSHWRGQALMNLARANGYGPGYTGGGVKTWYKEKIGYDPFRY